jgi:hypothetical protein
MEEKEAIIVNQEDELLVFDFQTRGYISWTHLVETSKQFAYLDWLEFYDEPHYSTKLTAKVIKLSKSNTTGNYKVQMEFIACPPVDYSIRWTLLLSPTGDVIKKAKN